MNNKGRVALIATLTAVLASASMAAAQSSQPSQTQQNQQDQNQSHYTGVSHPPPDSTIQADENIPPDADSAPPAAPAPASAAKPSAAIPATAANSAPAPAPTPAASALGSSAAAPAENPDYGIVTSVPDLNADAATGSNPTLKKRGYDPDNDIVNYVPSNPTELAEGTNIRVRLSENLSSADVRPGSTFRAAVVSDVYNGGRVIIPAGSEMRGRVVHVSQGHHLGPHATIRLRPDVVLLPDGTAYHLYAEAIQTGAAGTRVNGEGGIEASSHYEKDAAEYGAGAGTAALVGAAVAGPVGAGVGSVVGATAVTAHILMQHPNAADLPQGSLLIFSLTEPMDLTPTKN